MAAYQAKGDAGLHSATTAQEDYLFLVLADSNLPTGGFVASAGLEACWAHGLLRRWAATAPNGMSNSQEDTFPASGLVAFLQSSLDTYAHAVAGYIRDVHSATIEYIEGTEEGEGKGAAGTVQSRNQSALDAALAIITALDDAYSAMLLNHVAQRASRAQGVALLTLHGKSFADVEGNGQRRQQRGTILLRELKRRVRLGLFHGHLCICFAAFMAALDVTSAKRVLELHLFLQARAILSSAVRLNIVGPYQMHRILAFDAKRIIDEAVAQCSDDTTGLLHTRLDAAVLKGTDVEFDGNEPPTTELSTATAKDWSWTWDDEAGWGAAGGAKAPKTTWPLGDLVQGRHDQLHSRLFNS